VPIIFGARDMPARLKVAFVISVTLTFLGIVIFIAAIVCLVLIITRGLDWFIPFLLTLLGSLCLGAGALIQSSIAARLDKDQR
jgi:Na+-transporting NADH:ubiquinone oxidoreductase subunit NqrE